VSASWRNPSRLGEINFEQFRPFGLRPVLERVGTAIYYFTKDKD
jgi:hypothetical protein